MTVQCKNLHFSIAKSFITRKDSCSNTACLCIQKVRLKNNSLNIQSFLCMSCKLLSYIYARISRYEILIILL